MVDIKYKLAQNTVQKDDIDALCQWLQQEQTPQLSMGNLTKKFEEEVAIWVGRKYAVFCNSGSSANLLAVFALKYSNKLKNKTAVVPNVGWVTSVSPFLQGNFDTIMCKTDPKTFAIDLEDLERICKEENPAVVLFVQPLGVLIDKDKLLALKMKYGFILICDSCAAVGSQYVDGTKAGNVGDLSTWSMFFGHQVCSLAEGGVVFTNDRELYNVLVSIRSHGWLRNNDEDVRDGIFDLYNVDQFNQPFFFVYPGFNLRNSDVSAFVALRQIKKLDHFASIRDRNHMRYLERLSKHVEVQDIINNDIVSSISFAFLLKSNKQRKKVVYKLKENGIDSRLYSAGALFKHPFWTNRFIDGYDEYDRSIIEDDMGDRIHDTGIFVPNHQELSLDDVDFISDVIIKAL